jgi:hypothetical protein
MGVEARQGRGACAGFVAARGRGRGRGVVDWLVVPPPQCRAVAFAVPHLRFVFFRQFLLHSHSVNGSI